ncbi:MAG TPA: hypothetical protein VGQ36_23495 [Thermoanaerobaculia bacterium]|jgi:hypothetical protein|nr:hypothetical protein [Thermoanaerobaculia bacterium]
MISCDSFRTRFHAATDDAALLEHLRTCDRCLDFAAHADPDVMFRSLGGSEIVPPGGIDAFVEGVMQQVRVRDAETTIAASHGIAWPRRLAMVAAVAIAAFGATLVYRSEVPTTFEPIKRAELRTHALTTKPIVAAYDSQNATIIEIPTEKADDDVKIVMIFDENLPADL